MKEISEHLTFVKGLVFARLNVCEVIKKIEPDFTFYESEWGF